MGRNRDKKVLHLELTSSLKVYLHICQKQSNLEAKYKYEPCKEALVGGNWSINISSIRLVILIYIFSIVLG